MIVKISILDFMIEAGLKPSKMYLPKEQWDSVYMQLTNMQRHIEAPPKEPDGIFEARFFYREIEIIRELDK